jgi:hypothetical protein
MKTTIFITAIVALFAGMIFSIDWTPKTEAQDPFETELDKVNQIQARMLQSIPIPELQTSSERRNVAKRAEIFNNEEKISYIYLVNYGNIMAFYTVKGKVSSLQSYMSPLEQMVDYRGRRCDSTWSNSCGSTSAYIVSAPDVDGTYGENVEGIFFFTTEGAYVEWKGDYMMSDQPLKLTVNPILVREVK